MDKKEKSAVCLDIDKNYCEDIAELSTSVSNVNCSSVQSINSIINQSENETKPVNKQIVPEVNVHGFSTTSNYYSVTEMFGNLTLNNFKPLDSIEKDSLYDALPVNDTATRGTSANKSDESCNLNEIVNDEACASEETNESFTTHGAEFSNNVSVTNETEINSFDHLRDYKTCGIHDGTMLIPHIPVESVHKTDPPNRAHVSMDEDCGGGGSDDDTTEISSDQPSNLVCMDKTSEQTDASTFENKCDLNGKECNVENHRRQSSEIKERVMGFLTKYANIDDTPCGSQIVLPSLSKQECVKEKISFAVNKSNTAPKFLNAENSASDPNKTSNNITVGNSSESIPSSSESTKILFTSVSNIVPWNVGLCGDNSVKFSEIDCGSKHKNIPLIIQPVISSQSNNFIFNPFNCEPIVSTGLSNKYQLEQDKTMDTEMINVEASDSSATNRNEDLFQSIREIKLKEFQQRMPLGCEQLNLNTVSSILKTKQSIINTTHSFQRSNTNAHPVNSLCSSWQRISFQPHTTPSITFPILSSKSCNDHSSTKYSLLSESVPVCRSHMDSCETSTWRKKSAFESRRTKSSNATFCSRTNTFCKEGPTFSVKSNNLQSNASSERANFCGPYVPGTAGGGCENSPSMISSFTGNKIVQNTNSIFGGDIEQSPYCNNKPNFLSEDKSNRNSFAFNHFKSDMDNPFKKKSAVESIGLFNLPTKSAVHGVKDPIFKPFSSPLLFLSSKLPSGGGDLTETSCHNDKTGGLKLDSSKVHPQFAFQLEPEAKQTCTTMEFTIGSERNDELPTIADNSAFVGHSGNQEISENVGFYTKTSTSTTNVNFTLNAEKSVLFPSSHVPIRRTKKALRNSQVSKSCLIEKMPSIIDRGTTTVPFKPVYGSDMKLENGVNKNVIVRYQNIVFMENYSHTSPEELRAQHYSNKPALGPFKFSALVESKESHSLKKTLNQEIQTDEQLTSQKPDLAGIWRVLECPVCLDVVLPPVYQCEQGHHVCSSCWNKVITCPLCKKRKSFTRNYMAEALVEQVALPCRYHIEGCRETVQHVNKVSHEVICSYRMYQCPVPACKQAHSYQNMGKHFKKFHKNVLHHEGHSVGKGEKFCDVLYKEALTKSLIHAFDITKWGLFFLREVTVHQHSTALFVQLMPAVSDQSAYFYHLEVCDHNDCRKECYKGRASPMGKPTEEIIKQEEYLCLSNLILKTVKKTTPLKIVVTIWQLKSTFTLSTE